MMQVKLNWAKRVRDNWLSFKKKNILWEV